MDVSTVKNKLARGTLAGLAGTAAMTVLGMKPGAVRLLSEDVQPDRFLPRKVLRQTARAAGVDTGGGAREVALTAVLHAAYGAAAGAAYGMFEERRGHRPAWLAGAGYGLAIWAASYEGWIPALGLLPPTTDAPPRQWTVPVGSHLIFGVTTGLVFDRIASGRAPTQL